jgi:transposase
MAKKPSRTEYNVPAEVFIMTWQKAESVDEVSEKLDMPIPIVHARASGYRRNGINLKSMPRKKTNKLDVEKLNLLIEKIDEKKR